MNALVPAILILGLSYFMFRHVDEFGSGEGTEILPGKPLASYESFYPVRAAESSLYLDRTYFSRAVVYFTTNKDPRAIADLAYLGDANNVSLMLEPDTQEMFLNLTRSQTNRKIEQANQAIQRQLQSYTDLVNALGKTFQDTPIEISLLNVRNPLQAVVALQNPVTGRRLGDSATPFELQIIKGMGAVRQYGNYALSSYALTLPGNRRFKVTTIPIVDEPYGLIGLLSVHIDLAKMTPANQEEGDRLLNALRAVQPNAAVAQLLNRTPTSE